MQGKRFSREQLAGRFRAFPRASASIFPAKQRSRRVADALKSHVGVKSPAFLVGITISGPCWIASRIARSARRQGEEGGVKKRRQWNLILSERRRSFRARAIPYPRHCQISLVRRSHVEPVSRLRTKCERSRVSFTGFLRDPI